MTIMEIWNNESWIDDPYPFRIHLSINKDELSNKLHFKLGTQTHNNNQWINYWREINTNFSIPVGHWITLKTYFKEGDSLNGRFVFTATLEGGTEQVIFDITDFTHHPNDPFPDGISHYDPMKLYTNNIPVDYLRNNGGVLQVYWDDFKFWKNTNIISSNDADVFTGLKIFPNPMDEYSIIEFDNNNNENFTFI